MEGLELVAFNIISSVGTARSSYIEAIQKAKEGDFVSPDPPRRGPAHER